MLFDLRGRGRRRTIQGIYLGLAVLMGGGLVLFGVGGTGVGLFNNNNNNGSGGGSSVSQRLDAARKGAKAHPQEPARWLELARRVAQDAEIDQTTGQYTAKGRAELPEAGRAWSRYLALKPKPVDPRTARLMSVVFDADGLNRPKDRSAALQIVAQDQPTAASYRNLALAAYAAGQGRLGDLASAQALAHTTKSNRALIRSQLDAAKKQGAGASAGTNGGAGTSTVTP